LGFGYDERLVAGDGGLLVKPAEGRKTLLELNRVTVMRGERAALQDVSLRI